MKSNRSLLIKNMSVENASTAQAKFSNANLALSDYGRQLASFLQFGFIK